MPPHHDDSSAIHRTKEAVAAVLKEHGLGPSDMVHECTSEDRIRLLEVDTMEIKTRVTTWGTAIGSGLAAFSVLCVPLLIWLFSTVQAHEKQITTEDIQINTMRDSLKEIRDDVKLLVQTIGKGKP